MPIFFQRPENALKRANEFIDVGKKQRALDALYDVIKSKKHRQWSKTHEAIMEKYLQLCVELKKSHIAKEGLYQYKNISQQVSIKSLEDVVRKYLALAEEKTEIARKESHQAVVDVDDLDVIQTPENLLLSAVSGEDTQDRTDRAILTPWVKFLWESYRQCLDLLRNDGTVEKLYQDIAQQAFKFCLKYQRKTEFRKLCDNLRTHLSHIHKHQHKQRAINLNNPESQQLHLETRLVQLESAIQMELWMEAFKAVEDIHGLIQQSKKPPKPSLMANYYQKLGLVFWKSGNHMFHACAWHRMYHLIKEQRRNLTPEDLQKYSSRVLCATLAIPIPPSRNQIDTLMYLDDATQEKQRRLANLLGLKKPPTRAGLVKDLIKFGIPGQCQKELQNLYNSLEVEFHPLKLSVRVTEPLKFIAENKDLKQYVPAIQDITITRLIKQISQVYQTIEFDRFIKLVPFTNVFRMERVIVNTARNLQLQVRINHYNKSLSFGTDLGVAQKEDVPEGPYLQSMPSEQIRNQLSAMANALNKAQKVIQPIDVKKQDMQSQLCQNYKQVARKEHERILQRRIIIENRKEELENLSNRREQEEAELLENERRRQYDAEMQRLEKEAEERERQRHLQEHQEIQKKVAKERLEQLKSTEIGEKAFEGMTEDDIVKMDVDDILAKQVEQLEKEKKEMQEKLKGQMKKVDHFERAKRLEEIPFLTRQFDNENLQQKHFWEEQEQERIENMKVERTLAMEHKNRLKRMTEDRDSFLKQLTDARMSVFKEKLADFEKKLKEERKKRLEERKHKRKEERRRQFYLEKEEEEQRIKDEEAKRQREEEERAEQERKAKEEEEYNERLKKLEEIEERKRQREIEIEERAKKEKEERLRNVPESGGGQDRREGSEWRRDDQSPEKPGSAWKPSGRSGGWREREKQKEDSWSKEDRGGGAWRDRRDDRDDRGRDDDRGPRRDDDMGSRRDDDRPPRRDDDRDLRRDDDRGARRDDDRGPRRDDDRGPRRDDGPRRDFGGLRRDDEPRRDDRGPSDWRRGDDRGGSDRRDDRGPRRDDREWRRDDRGPPPRDRDDRGPPPRDRDDRGPPPRDRDDWRSDKRGLDRRDDRGGGGRWERDERRDDQKDDGPWRGGGRDRDEKGGSSWRDRERGGREEPAWRRGGDDRGPRDRDERGPPPRDRDDRGAPPRDRDDRRGPPPRDRDERGAPPPRTTGAWRRDDSERESDWRKEPRRDDGDRPPPRGEDRPPPRSEDRPPRGEDRPPPRSEERSAPKRDEADDDGWTTVKR